VLPTSGELTLLFTLLTFSLLRNVTHQESTIQKKTLHIIVIKINACVCKSYVFVLTFPGLLLNFSTLGAGRSKEDTASKKQNLHIILIQFNACVACETYSYGQLSKPGAI